MNQLLQENVDRKINAKTDSSHYDEKEKPVLGEDSTDIYRIEQLNLKERYNYELKYPS